MKKNYKHKARYEISSFKVFMPFHDFLKIIFMLQSSRNRIVNFLEQKQSRKPSKTFTNFDLIASIRIDWTHEYVIDVRFFMGLFTLSLLLPPRQKTKKKIYRHIKLFWNFSSPTQNVSTKKTLSKLWLFGSPIYFSFHLQCPVQRY